MLDENADRVQGADRDAPVPKRDVEPFWPPEQIEAGRPASTPPVVPAPTWPGSTSGWPPAPGSSWPPAVATPSAPAVPDPVPVLDPVPDPVLGETAVPDPEEQEQSGESEESEESGQPPVPGAVFADQATRAWPVISPAQTSTSRALDLDQPFSLDEPLATPITPVHPGDGPTGAGADTSGDASGQPATGLEPMAFHDNGAADPHGNEPTLFHGTGPTTVTSGSTEASRGRAAPVSPWAQPPQRMPGEQPATAPTGTAAVPHVGREATPGAPPAARSGATGPGQEPGQPGPATPAHPGPGVAPVPPQRPVTPPPAQHGVTYPRPPQQAGPTTYPVPPQQGPTTYPLPPQPGPGGHPQQGPVTYPQQPGPGGYPTPAPEPVTEPSGWTAQPAASWQGEGWRSAPSWQQTAPPVATPPQQHPGVAPVPQQPYQETPGVVRVPAAGYPDPAWPAEGAAPTAEDFARRRAARPADPVATMGLRAAVNKSTMGLVRLSPGRQEQELKRDIDMVRRNFGGLRQVTVVNPKGGAGKTVAILLLAMTFGQKRGGYVLAWDNNETQGTLGMRAQQDFHSRTVRDMLRDLGQFQGAHGRVGDLSQYVRSQGEGMFDVLASDESATGGEMLTASAFAEIRDVVSRFYKLIFVDTGNNVRAHNWQASMDATDQLVVTMSARNDSAETAARMLDHLEQSGRQRLVRQAVTVVSMPPSRKEIDLPAIEQHFAARTRAVLLAPYERLIDTGEPIRYGQLSAATRDAWLKIAAAVAEGL